MSIKSGDRGTRMRKMMAQSTAKQIVNRISIKMQMNQEQHSHRGGNVMFDFFAFGRMSIADKANSFREYFVVFWRECF